LSPTPAHPSIITGRRVRCLALTASVALASVVTACGAPRGAEAPAARETPVAPPAPSGEDKRIVLFLGTSLTAGYGLSDPDEAYPGLIQKRIDAAGLPFRAVNAGVSGETSAGALRRLDWLLKQKVDVLLVETGGNDALRGQDPEATRANIDAILSRAEMQSPPPRLVILGMKAPPNLGPAYLRRFDAIYPDLARKHGAVLVPFLLEGVGGVAALNQADGIHPTPEGQRRMAELVWRALEPLLRSSP
jgi:acyl-CoA thioesterase-1